MKDADILQRLIEETRFAERMRGSLERTEDMLWQAQRDLAEATKPNLAMHQLIDIAVLVLKADNELATRKIMWIKEVRALTSCGLKEAKDAVEGALQQHSIAALRDKLMGVDPPF